MDAEAVPAVRFLGNQLVRDHEAGSNTAQMMGKCQLVSIASYRIVS